MPILPNPPTVPPPPVPAVNSLTWAGMAAELVGQAPIPYSFALTLVSRAWVQIQREFLWSFLWFDVAIPTPSPISYGQVTVAPGTMVITGDANASSVWLSTGLVTPITSMQFRIGQGTIYNVLAMDPTNPSAVQLILDRAFVDPIVNLSGNGYQLLGVYFNAPCPDFVWWESIRDPVSGYTLETTMTREEVDQDDPQRFQSGWPHAVLPYLVNPWPSSPYLGYPMYEIWPAPLNNYTYVATGFRSGMPFSSPTDQVTPPLGPDIVIARAKMYAYEWAMAHPDAVPKAGWQYLYNLAKAEYSGKSGGGGLLGMYMLRDEETSHRYKISHSDSGYISNLPWVSMQTGYAYFP